MYSLIELHGFRNSLLFNSTLKSRAYCFLNSEILSLTNSVFILCLVLGLAGYKRQTFLLPSALLIVTAIDIPLAMCYIE